MSNVTVTVNQANITVDEANSNVAVTTTQSNITVAEIPIISDAIIRAALSVTDTGGDGSLTYSNISGVFTYTGPDQTEANARITGAPLQVRQHVSATNTGGDGSLSYSNTTGVFTYTGPDQTEANARIAAAPLQVRAHLNDGDGIFYNSTTGVISADISAILGNLTTTDITEGTNLYYTTDRANTAITDFDGALTPSSLTTTGNVESDDHVVGRKIISGVRTSATTVTANGNIEAGNIALSGTGKLELGGNVEGGSSTQFIGGSLDIGSTIPSDIAGWEFDGGTNRLGAPITGSPGAQSQYYVDLGGAATQFPNFTWVNDSNSDLQKWEVGYGVLGSNNLIGGGYTWYRGNNTLQANTLEANTIETTGNINSGPLYVTGDSTIVGNLQVNGNIDYVNVEDLLVTDNTITLNYGNAAARDAFIYVDRSGTGGGTNAHIKWNETSDGWEFYDATDTVAINDLLQNVVEDTTPQLGGDLDLNGKTIQAGNANSTLAAIEFGSGYGVGTGGRLYGDTTEIAIDSGAELNFLSQGNTEIRYNEQNAATDVFRLRNAVNTVLEAGYSVGPDLKLGRSNALEIDGASLTLNGELNYANATVVGALSSNANITTTANVSGAYILGDGSALTSSLTNYTTSDLTEGTNLYYTDGRFDTRLATKSTTDLAEGTNLYYTNARANAAFVDSLDNITTAIVSDSNITTTANISADNVLTDVVESATSVTLYGKGTGVELDKAIDSTDVSTIVNLDTTGYSLADATTPADFTVGDHTPSLIVSLTTVAGSPTAFVGDLYGGALGSVDAAMLRGPGFSSGFTSGNPDLVLTPEYSAVPGTANIEAAFNTTGSTFAFIPANGLNNSSAGLYGSGGKGWSVFNTTTQSAEDVFPLNAYSTGVLNNTITFSENALVSATTTLLLLPGMAQTSGSNVILKYYAKNNTNAGGNAEPTGLYGRLSTFDQPETLSNVTFDALSYGNVSSVTMSSVNTKNIADFEGQAESAARFPRGLLIGPSTTPDAFSGRTGLNDSSALGVILENDGETYTGNNAPAAKFLINSYSGNLDDLTYYPNWASQGATGNITLDLPQLKAPQLQLKSFRGAKSTANASSYLLEAGDVVGKVVFSPGQTTGTGFQGADLFNPPSAITVDVGDANITTVANAYMHLTTTPDPKTNLGYMRNNTDNTSGANQQTNFTTKAGNVTIAAQVDGKITLAPTPDYGDAANSTVWTRYPGSTHEYHTYLDAGFLDNGAKTGTLVEIQPKSGTTTGSGGLGYDSIGDATLRINVHESNGVMKKRWEITNEQSTGNLLISDNTSGTPDTFIHLNGGRVFIDKSLQLQNLTTAEINALASPQAGDVVFNTTLTLICFYNGSTWQKINSSAMGS